VRVDRIRDGLWRWSVPHPDWVAEGEGPLDWPEAVGCVYYEAPTATVLIDPLVPADPAQAARFWRALDADVVRRGLPVAVLRTIPWHERSCAAVRERYPGATAAAAGVEPIALGDPFGEVAYLIEQHAALVPGDLLLGADVGGGAPGDLDVCPASWFGETAAARRWYVDEAPAAVARLAALPIAMVLVSHGTPVIEGGAAAIDAALGRLTGRRRPRG
jgi:hypothetical protein